MCAYTCSSFPRALVIKHLPGYYWIKSEYEVFYQANNLNYSVGNGEPSEAFEQKRGIIKFAV
jgi:hypothetical protein